MHGGCGCGCTSTCLSRHVPGGGWGRACRPVVQGRPPAPGPRCLGQHHMLAQFLRGIIADTSGNSPATSRSDVLQAQSRPGWLDKKAPLLVHVYGPALPPCGCAQAPSRCVHACVRVCDLFERHSVVCRATKCQVARPACSARAASASFPAALMRASCPLQGAIVVACCRFAPVSDARGQQAPLLVS